MAAGTVETERYVVIYHDDMEQPNAHYYVVDLVEKAVVFKTKSYAEACRQRNTIQVTGRFTEEVYA